MRLDKELPWKAEAILTFEVLVSVANYCLRFVAVVAQKVFLIGQADFVSSSHLSVTWPVIQIAKSGTSVNQVEEAMARHPHQEEMYFGQVRTSPMNQTLTAVTCSRNS